MDNKNLQIIVFVLVIFVIYLVYKDICRDKKIEKMTDDISSKSTTTDDSELNSKINAAVDNIYQSDIESIRNLEQIAKKLQEEGLTIPGNLTVGGTLTVNKKSTVNSLEVKNSSDFGTGSNRKLRIESTNYSNTGTYISFYNGGTRLGYLIPRTNKNLELVNMNLDSNLDSTNNNASNE